MVLKRVCIKDINIVPFSGKYQSIHIKFGEQFECEVYMGDFGTHVSKINGIETHTWISLSDLNKVSVDIQDIRNLKLVLLTNDYTANKRLKKKIQTAHKMNDYYGVLKHLSKAERFN